MGKFELYSIDLKNLTPGIHEFDYVLENKFFVDIDGDLVQKGKIKAHVRVKKSSLMSEINFHCDGVVMIPCDRCLDDMEQPIDTDNRLIVKFGEEYAEENDEILIIPEEEGKLNIAWFLYEFIALAIPIKHVHAPGNCNKAMSAKLSKHRARSIEDEDGLADWEDDEPQDDNRPIDPRWEALRNLVENDNN